MTTEANSLATLIRARGHLYKTIIDHDRHDLNDVVVALDEAIRLLGAQHTAVMRAAFAEFLAAE